MDNKNGINPNENMAELNDETMAKVSGGDIHYPTDGKAYRREDIKFVYSVGDRVEVWQTIFGNTKRATITNCYIEERYESDTNRTAAYYPVYDVSYDDGGGENAVRQDQISR